MSSRAKSRDLKRLLKNSAFGWRSASALRLSSCFRAGFSRRGSCHGKGTASGASMNCSRGAWIGRGTASAVPIRCHGIAALAAGVLLKSVPHHPGKSSSIARDDSFAPRSSHHRSSFRLDIGCPQPRGRAALQRRVTRPRSKGLQPLCSENADGGPLKPDFGLSGTVTAGLP